MIKFLFLIPVVLCGIWFFILKSGGYSIEQGKKGFIYILMFSAAIALFYAMMMWVTQR